MIIKLYDMLDLYRKLGLYHRSAKCKRIIYHQEMEANERAWKIKHGYCLLCDAKTGAPDDTP